MRERLAGVEEETLETEGRLAIAERRTVSVEGRLAGMDERLADGRGISDKFISGMDEA